jgi:hypothetical protein
MGKEIEGGDSSFAGSIGKNDLQEINIAKSIKTKKAKPFFEWLGVPKKRGLGFFEWLEGEKNA